MNCGYNKYQHPNAGIEFDFPLLNFDRRLIFLSTAGYGPVPHEAMELGTLDLFEEILKLEASTSSVRVLLGPGDYTDWDEVARRGFFAFDWCISTDRFRLVARPAEPRTPEELPVGLVRDLACKARVLDEDVLSAETFVPSWI